MDLIIGKIILVQSVVPNTYTVRERFFGTHCKPVHNTDQAADVSVPTNTPPLHVVFYLNHLRWFLGAEKGYCKRHLCVHRFVLNLEW